ncbi:glycosyltransferase [Hyunsoonleella pacifica]|uniref:Glycosyltransferase n=1 Tax=Hyunsoonleella pacifica TaxID=1080224 RepID=A0A4Q9FPH7_9FLAO|nr:glycosyltransferase [Hyunsoonleella pacifica]TBN16736.1 glycosyltransferase [Hyunsoonleella pacifica]GGD16896.1 hypothetical protein GCM10011368_18570 [Hyunsoonleella pacifica]
MRNIILISFFWTGIRDFFLKGELEFKGMPAFTNTFLKLLHDDRIGTIYVIFFGKHIGNKYKINKKYSNKIKVYGFDHKGGISTVKAIVNLFCRTLRIICNNKINVIYGHGSTAGFAGIIGNITGIQNVRRIYGTFLCDKLDKSKWHIFLNHPLEFFAFSLPAKAIICTNDGTKGDLVYNKIGHKKSTFYFWLNGIDKANNIILPYEEINQKYKIGFTPQICYLARIDKWKRQHLLVEALKKLHQKKIIYNTIIAGPIINKEYYEGLSLDIKDNGLSDYIKLIPGFTKEESISVIKHSELSVSFYDFSNLGNVFLESLSLGTVMLSENINNSLELIDEKVYYNTNPLNSEETANLLEDIFKNKQDLFSKSEEAIKFSHEYLLTWPERAAKEISLLGLS